MPIPVKPRRYDSTARLARAQERREVVLDAALARFLRDGFAATTVAALADDAGVSTELIYKSFGGKAGLVRALRTRALEGDHAEPAEQRADRLRDEQDAEAILRGWAHLATEVAPRVTPVLLLVRDAATTDATVRGLQAELDADRFRRMTSNATALHRGGHLRAGVGVRTAADLMFAVSSPEMYELLVLRRQWSLRRYEAYVFETLRAGLLPGRA